MIAMRRVGLSAAVLLLCGRVPSLAQQPQQTLPEVLDDLHMNETLQSRFDRRGLIEPVEAGPFLITAQVQSDIGFNNNVFAQPTGRQSDFFVDIGGKIATLFHYDAFSAELDTFLLDHQFLTLTTEDYWEANERLSLRMTPSPDFAYFLQDGIQRLAVPRTDPNPIDGKTPATYLLYDALGGVNIGNGADNLFTLSAGYDQTEFDRVEGADGPINTTQRNRTEVFGDFRFDHTFFGDQKAFIELRPDTRDYAQIVDTAGFKQSSNGGRIDTGFVFERDGVYLVSISGGYQQQDYADPRFGAIGEPEATVEIQWSPSQLLQIDAKYIHEYAEDIDVDSPGYTHDQAILTIGQEFRRNFLATLYISDDFRELERSPRRFELLDVGPRLEYRLPDNFTLGFNYDHEQLGSNNPVKYGDDIALFNVKKQF